VFDLAVHRAAGIQSLIPCEDLVGCELADASLLMPLEVYLRLVTAHVPRQQIKDIVSAAALSLGVAWPALYGDLKVLWIPGRVLRSPCAVLVGCEPAKGTGARKTLRTFSAGPQTPAQPWLGFLACGTPGRHPFFQALAEECLTVWAAFAEQVLAGRRSVVDFSEASPLWMKNTSILASLTERFASEVERVSPRRICPLPAWSRSVDAHEVWGYARADLDEILANPNTVAVTRWTERQHWSQAFMREVGRAFWLVAEGAAVAAGDEARLRARTSLHALVAETEASWRGFVEPLLSRRVLLEASAVIGAVDLVRVGVTGSRADAHGVVMHAFTRVLGANGTAIAERLNALGGDSQRSAAVARLLSSLEY